MRSGKRTHKRHRKRRNWLRSDRNSPRSSVSSAWNILQILWSLTAVRAFFEALGRESVSFLLNTSSFPNFSKLDYSFSFRYKMNQGIPADTNKATSFAQNVCITLWNLAPEVLDVHHAEVKSSPPGLRMERTASSHTAPSRSN